MQQDQNQGMDHQVADKEVSAQEQLLEQQKKFRNLESDRKAYAEETVANIKKQRGIIDKLKNENYILKDLIAKMNSQKLQLNQTTYSKGPNIDTIIDDLKVAINEEKKVQEEIDTHVADFQKKIIEKRHALGGYNAGAENESALQKQIKILENRLDKTNQKFNEAIAINKQLRQQIDSLRRERVIFDNLYKKLEKELHEKRKEMADIIETANTAYEERDKANDLIQSLKQQAKRESADFEKDLRELSQIMEKNKKTLDYMKLTEKNREMDQQEVVDPDKFTKPKTSKLTRDKTVNQTIVEQIMKYEEDFAKIQAATQIKVFDELIKIFIQNEEKNFQMFKYVNELSNEIEDLEKQIGELKDEASLYEGQGSNVDVQRKRHLKDLEEKLSRSEQKSESYEFKYNESIKLINSLTNWIETLFNTVECDKQMATEIAGSHGVTDTNMMIYLGLIENKTNKLLQYYQQIHQKISENQINSLQQLAQMNEKNLQNKNRAELPQFDEHEDDDIEGDKILSVEEFKKKALEKLEKQQNQTKNKRAGPNKLRKNK
ncbi:unnamed protein product [Paramecium primaurelia]|uniref:ODAD1 central coiled coil region domain-containing protein n=1 Tax=Paramecium primaurelia TaxID=5886 RepID=A0A8S1N832_PARPR|nr:unnamed protein product [Paramecium primaurelia]